MPSELAADALPSPAPVAAPRLAWLRSQELGLVCGFLAVLLLAGGSVVLAATREGASAAVQMDELGGFFAPVRVEHLWLYALVPVMALYALNTALCTWDSVVKRLRRGARDLPGWAPVLLHVAFLFLLLGHGVSGLWAREGAPVELGRDWTPLEGGEAVRVVDWTLDRLPSGRLKAADLKLELRDAQGGVREEHLGYNQPVSSGFGARLLLIARLNEGPGAGRWEPVALARLRTNPGHPLSLVGVVLLSLGLVAMGRRWLKPALTLPPTLPSETET